MKWITVTQRGTSPSGKTNVYDVVALVGGYFLGQVRWYPAWRKYAFFPDQYTIFEEDCMRDIAQFLDDTTKAHKAAKKQ